jgi:uncharacterized membrane protein
MIFANSTPYLFDLKNFFTLRYIYTTAAPVFIFLAGFTGQMNFERGNPISYYRIFQILVIAVLIDVLVWRSVPFYTFDVLYLIAFSKFLLHLLQKINKNKIHLLFLGLFIYIYIFLSNKLGYRSEISDILLKDFINNYRIYINLNPINRLLYDGWFPIFPWTIIVIIGAVSYTLLKEIKSKYSIYLITASILSLSILYFILFSIHYPVREKYLELFYPLNNLLLLIPFSIFLLVIGIIKWQPSIKYEYVNLLGKYSLFAYLINAIIDAVLEQYDFQSSTLNLKLFLLFLSFVILILLLKIIDKIKLKPVWENIPKGLKFILGL